HPRTVVTDRLKSYPGALREMKREGELWRFTRHRRGRRLNNRVEQDHRRIKPNLNSAHEKCQSQQRLALAAPGVGTTFRGRRGRSAGVMA
ncbi:MAG TPA: DDE-type integrase/transposase/recombinase, partial [Geminicoccaceae bacterium]|nr:DDE-type integrase/transposase/recombinase [Geminicoccaceae bacterium]